MESRVEVQMGLAKSIGYQLAGTDASGKTPFTGKFARGVLVYTILVIVFGAFVRATNSGDGCGAHWPLCNGEVIPLNAPTARIIEFTHRLTSGLAGIIVFALLLSVYRHFAAGSPARKAAVLATVFMIFEALIGAVLVK